MHQHNCLRYFVILFSSEKIKFLDVSNIPGRHTPTVLSQVPSVWHTRVVAPSKVKFGSQETVTDVPVDVVTPAVDKLPSEGGVRIGQSV